MKSRMDEAHGEHQVETTHVAVGVPGREVVDHVVAPAFRLSKKGRSEP